MQLVREQVPASQAAKKSRLAPYLNFNISTDVNAAALELVYSPSAGDAADECS
jgi:hypothetical protein